MILVDTSIWIDHLRRGEPGLIRLLEQAEVLVHPFVIGELALGGQLSQRTLILQHLDNLPRAILVEDVVVLGEIERHRLPGSGIGYVDAHLVASALAEGAALWTRDRRLADVARRLSLAPEFG